MPWPSRGGSVGSSLCKWAGTGSVHKHLCVQWLSSMESTDKINVWESVRQEEGCRVGLARGLVHMLRFSYQRARKSGRTIQKKAKK